jgi:hypothetical protein
MTWTVYLRPPSDHKTEESRWILAFLDLESGR